MNIIHYYYVLLLLCWAGGFGSYIYILNGLQGKIYFNHAKWICNLNLNINIRNQTLDTHKKKTHFL